VPGRESLSTEEWELLQFAPLWAFYAVAAADGTLQRLERIALKEAIDRPSSEPGSLGHEVFSSIGADFGGVMSRYWVDPRGVEDGLAAAADVLEARFSDDEAEHFKQAIARFGLGIAQAAGPAGQAVTDEESAALIAICEALRLSGDLGALANPDTER
jgi:hypothetical protein